MTTPLTFERTHIHGKEPVRYFTPSTVGQHLGRSPQELIKAFQPGGIEQLQVGDYIYKPTASRPGPAQVMAESGLDKMEPMKMAAKSAKIDLTPEQRKAGEAAQAQAQKVAVAKGVQQAPVRKSADEANTESPCPSCEGRRGARECNVCHGKGVVSKSGEALDEEPIKKGVFGRENERTGESESDFGRAPPRKPGLRDFKRSTDGYPERDDPEGREDGDRIRQGKKPLRKEEGDGEDDRPCPACDGGGEHLEKGGECHVCGGTGTLEKGDDYPVKKAEDGKGGPPMTEAQKKAWAQSRKDGDRAAENMEAARDLNKRPIKKEADSFDEEEWTGKKPLDKPAPDHEAFVKTGEVSQENKKNFGGFWQSMKDRLKFAAGEKSEQDLADEKAQEYLGRQMNREKLPGYDEWKTRTPEEDKARRDSKRTKGK